MPVLLLSGGIVSRVSAQNGTAAVPALEIKNGVEYEFQSVDGAAYLVDGSVDGVSFNQVAGPIFGDGTKMKAILPPAAAAGQRQFRVRMVSATPFGPATTLLGGKTVALNDGGRLRQVVFFPSIQGVRRGMLKSDATHARSFTWKVKRTTGSVAEVELIYFDGTTSTLELNFSNGLLGAYQMRDRNLEGQVQVLESGPFSLHTGRLRDRVEEAVFPTTLAGQNLIFEEGGAMTRLDFGLDGTVNVNRPDGTTDNYHYIYDRNSADEAELKLEGTPELPGEIIQMDLSSQSTGNFNRLPQALPGGGGGGGGHTGPLQTGTFNIPTVPVSVNSTSGPPRSLDGKVIQIGGDKPVTLTFNSDGTGTATEEEDGSVEVKPFTYNYSPTDDDEASLALTFPGAQSDRVEDYDLQFGPNASGSFQSSTYEGGELANSSSGSFNTGGS
ncbi:MAG: hypothetical protein JWL81_2323 [Verrucomicrobiales bacterium]|nr:hypothetical protein [Verrucomicrobiales bacterium]